MQVLRSIKMGIKSSGLQFVLVPVFSISQGAFIRFFNVFLRQDTYKHTRIDIDIAADALVLR